MTSPVGARGAGVLLDITTSLDGFIAGPNDDVERLHEWLFTGDTPTRSGPFRASRPSAEIIDEWFAATGAFVMGKRTFALGEKPWGDDPPFRKPCFVVTHEAREELTRGATTFRFVTDGVPSAVEQARAAARGSRVTVMGGASVAQQCVEAGLIDEMQIHLVPLLLGAGIRLFEEAPTTRGELETTRIIEAPGVVHLRFRVAP